MARVGVLYTSGSGFGLRFAPVGAELASPGRHAPLCSNYAEMAQWQRNRLVSDRLGVQISFSALREGGTELPIPVS